MSGRLIDPTTGRPMGGTPQSISAEQLLQILTSHKMKIEGIAQAVQQVDTHHTQMTLFTEFLVNQLIDLIAAISDKLDLELDLGLEGFEVWAKARIQELQAEQAEFMAQQEKAAMEQAPEELKLQGIDLRDDRGDA